MLHLPALPRLRHTLLVAALAVCPSATAPLTAQDPAEAEVRQLVTFRFLPGRSADALTVFRDRALPLYEGNAAMLRFRAFREVESPVPLDLVVVSSFRGMAGMDASNDALRALAEEAGTSIGAIYGAISEASRGHDDQFVSMRSELRTGDPTSRRLMAMVWYRTLPGEQANFERMVGTAVVEWERSRGIPTETGRFLLSDGWTHLRFLGFDSLAEYEAYWEDVGTLAGHGYMESLTAVRREVIVAPVPDLSVR